MKNSYDIVVIGAGPAGSSAAKAAAEKGAKVLLVDRKQRVGVPVQCAEFVPQWISRQASFSSSCIMQRVEKMITHLPDGASYEMQSPGFMLDRTLFDKELVAAAVLSGARISIGTKAVSLSPEELLAEHDGKKEIIRSKVFIGADGANSTMARMVGQPSLRMITALQYEVILPARQNHVDVYFHRDYEGGYGWLFPKGKTANAGIGVSSSKASRLPDLLHDFLDLLRRSGKLREVKIIAKTGGLIPCEFYEKLLFKDVLLIGDAAGHAHPVTGAGTFNAVLGGEIAGRIAAEAIERGDLRYLENYETEWHETFGRFLSYGLLKRKFLQEHWNEPGVDFEDLIRKTWIGFKEYHAERRKTPLTPPLPTEGNVPLP